MSRTADAASILPAATNAHFGSFHRQRAPLTPPAPVRSSRQNARSSRLPFGFRLELRRGVPLRIPPLPPCSIPPLHSPRRNSRQKLKLRPIRDQVSIRKNFRQKGRVHLQFIPYDRTIGKQWIIREKSRT
jgi:hypothetical protein